MIESSYAQTANTLRLEDLRVDGLRKWRETCGTLEQSNVFWSLMLDRLLKDLRGRAV